MLDGLSIRQFDGMHMSKANAMGECLNERDGQFFSNVSPPFNAAAGYEDNIKISVDCQSL